MPDLVSHPTTPCALVTNLRVQVVASCHLIYTLTGALNRLRLPPPGPACRRDRLWEHTCFEVFLKRPEEEAYIEFNVAPSGAWQMYAFAAYRQRGPDPDLPPPAVLTSRTETTLTLDVCLPALTTSPARLAIAAVIEDETGTLSYWALHHPAAVPDFHHPDSFTLQVTP